MPSQVASRWIIFFLCAIIGFFLSASASWASATDVYITPDGSGQGVCTNNPHPPSWFNDSANWGSASTQIGPGTTVHLCGTFNESAGATLLSFQGSGTNGNMITLKFETGAQLLAPYWGSSSSGAIFSNGNNYIAVDGGTNGLIQNTSNGSSGGTCPGGTCTYQQPSNGVYLLNCSNCTVQNLTVADFYDHTTKSDENGGETGAISIKGGSNVTFNNNTIHDARYGIFYGYYGTNSNITISNNTIYHCDASIAVADASNNDNVTNVYIYGNDVRDSFNWNDASYNFHHDMVHNWATATNNNITNLQVYSNYFHGDFGAGTALTYVEQYSGLTSISIFNNVYAPTGATGDTGGGAGTWLQTGGGRISAEIYNNTYSGSGIANLTAIWLQGTQISADIRNNIVYNWGTLFVTNGAALPATMDYNDWNLATGGSGWWNNNGGGYSTLSSWQSATGFDAHSSGSAPNFDSTFKLQPGSPAIALATNLTSLDITALDRDKAGVARPSGSAAWSAGAYQFSATQTPSSPTGLTVTVH